MISQEFSYHSLNHLRRRGAQFKYVNDLGTIPKDSEEWRLFLHSLESEILDGSFKYRPFGVRTSGGAKPMFSTNSLENIMVMRKINDNIRRAYGVKQANRFDVIRQIQQALRETTPKRVLRLDIKSFYESIPRGALIRKLREDRLVSTRTIGLLIRLLKFLSHMGSRGLPRGLQISATLAELYALHLDRELRSIHGVYYLARYVDDIVIFSFMTDDSVDRQVDDVFQRIALKMNKSKSYARSVECRCAITCVHGNQACSCAKECKCANTAAAGKMYAFDVLGYKIAFRDVNNLQSSKKPNLIGTYIGDKKIEKYKRRIDLSVNNFRKTADFALLRDRILFLTGNYRLTASKTDGQLKGGVYYNFDLYAPLEDASILSSNRLEHLDTYLRQRVYGSIKRSATISRSDKRRILSMSFANGFRYRRLRDLPPKRITEIGECWNEA